MSEALSGYTAGEQRNCRKCQQPIYFGGVHWWHKHNESSFCSTGDAEPELDETERVRAAALELLGALKGLLHHYDDATFGGDYYLGKHLPTARKDALAAIAKAEGK